MSSHSIPLTNLRHQFQLQPLAEQSRKIFAENLRLNATLNRQKRTIQKLLGEDGYDSEEDDINIESLKEEIIDLQERLAVATDEQERLTAENEKLLQEQDEKQEKMRMTSSAGCEDEKNDNSSTTLTTEELMDKNIVEKKHTPNSPEDTKSLKKRIEDLEAELAANAELLQEADEQFERLATEIPVVENRNQELLEEIKVQYETEDELRKKIEVDFAFGLDCQKVCCVRVWMSTYDICFRFKTCFSS